MINHDREGALTQLRAYLAQEKLPENSRLPAERRLGEILGVSRSALRQALAALESEGQVWRHVGRGTFTGKRPSEHGSDFATIASETNPRQAMEARLNFEPELSRLAALHATRSDIVEMENCMRKSMQARSWRVYENWDNRLHRSIALATHNPLMVTLFDVMNTVRRTVVWGRLRSARLPNRNHHSFEEHRLIVTAIAERDLERAAKYMEKHLQNVERKLMQHPRHRDPGMATELPDSGLQSDRRI
jgi:DNA-binding FadR family transcriptional regulator